MLEVMMVEALTPVLGVSLFPLLVIPKIISVLHYERKF